MLAVGIVVRGKRVEYLHLVELADALLTMMWPLSTDCWVHRRTGAESGSHCRSDGKVERPRRSSCVSRMPHRSSAPFAALVAGIEDLAQRRLVPASESGRLWETAVRVACATSVAGALPTKSSCLSLNFARLACCRKGHIDKQGR
jgi:hypothetical protein